MLSPLTVSPGETGDWLITITTAADEAQSLEQLEKAWFTVKHHYADDDEDALFQLTLDSGLTVENESGGVIRAVAANTLTALLTKGATYDADVRLMFTDGTTSNPTGCLRKLIADKSVTDAKS